MKRILTILILAGLLFGCTEKFKEINENPAIGLPPAEFLLTYVEKSLATYKGGGEWYHENHQIMSWAQYLVMGEANSSIIPATAMILPPGAFITLGLMLWGLNVFNSRRKG